MIKNNVLFGKENWLFLHNGGQKQFNYLLEVEKVSDLSVDSFCSNMQERYKYCQEKNIDYLHVVFPSKPVIKKNFLPDEYSGVKSLFKNYYASCDGLSSYVLYPFESLVSLEEKHSTFHKYNTHNSDYGYLEIVKTIFERLGYKLNFHEYIEGVSKKSVSGDLAEMASLSVVNEEEFISLSPGLKVYRAGNRGFLPGNTNDVVILHNIDSVSQKRLLVFGDSFIKGTLKFLSIFFKEVFYIRSAFFHKDIVELYSPDVVFTSNAERYLCTVESDGLANNFIMSLYGSKYYSPSDSYLEAFEACLSYNYYPHLYSNWVCKLSDSFEVSDSIENYFEKIQQGLNGDLEPASILREVALAFERSNDIRTAQKIMYQAHLLRPEGPAIRKKLEYYQQLLVSK